MKKILLLIFLIPFIAYSQFPKDIIKQSCYGTSEKEEAHDMIVTDHAIYILSQTKTVNDSINNEWNYDLLVTKLDKHNNLIWQKSFGGTSNDVPTSIIADELGNVYFGGAVYSNDGDIQSGNMGGLDAWIVKIDQEGIILWEKTFGGSRDDYGARLIYMNNGDLLAYGATFSDDFDLTNNFGFLDLWFWQLTTDGEIKNKRSYGSTMSENIFSLIETSDGGFFYGS